MAHLTEEEILHIAKLAKLTLIKEEIKKFGGQLSKVIEFIGELGKVDVKDIEPTAQVTGLENVYRQDNVNASNVLPQSEALNGTDKTHNGYFKVGAILSERSDK